MPQLRPRGGLARRERARPRARPDARPLRRRGDDDRPLARHARRPVARAEPRARDRDPARGRPRHPAGRARLDREDPDRPLPLPHARAADRGAPGPPPGRHGQRLVRLDARRGPDDPVDGRRAPAGADDRGRPVRAPCAAAGCPSATTPGAATRTPSTSAPTLDALGLQQARQSQAVRPPARSRPVRERGGAPPRRGARSLRQACSPGRAGGCPGTGASEPGG